MRIYTWISLVSAVKQNKSIPFICAKFSLQFNNYRCRLIFKRFMVLDRNHGCLKFVRYIFYLDTLDRFCTLHHFCRFVLYITIIGNADFDDSTISARLDVRFAVCLQAQNIRLQSDVLTPFKYLLPFKNYQKFEKFPI